MKLKNTAIEYKKNTKLQGKLSEEKIFIVLTYFQAHNWLSIGSFSNDDGDGKSDLL